MGSPIQAILAQASAAQKADGGGVTGTSMEQLCKDAGTNQRKREALGCPPLEGTETVNKPTVPTSETPGDPDIGVQEADTEAAGGTEAYKPTALDLALRKKEMNLPLTDEEQAAFDIYMKEQTAAPATPAAKPGLWQRAMEWMGMGE